MKTKHHRRGRLTFATGVAIGLAAPAAIRYAAGRASTGFPSDEAHSPHEIPARGWTKIAARTWRAFNTDRIPAVAAGAAFYALLALFPAVAAFASLYGLFANLTDARHQVAALGGVLPGGAVSVLDDQLARLAAAPHTGLGLTFLLGLLISLWSANAGVKALLAGITIAYEETERRSFLALNATSLAFTLGLVVFALVAVGAIVAVPGALHLAGLGSLIGLSFLRWPLLLLVVGALLSVLYRYGPSREHARWRWITPGSGAASLAWMAMSLMFSWYVAHFGHYDQTYGSLGAAVGFITWIWLSLIVILVGAELNAEIEKQTSVDTTTGPAAPKGLRGAAVADRKEEP